MKEFQESDLEDAIPILILGRDDGRTTVMGSIKWDADCGHRCWMSPHAVKLSSETPGIKTVCMECSPTYLKTFELTTDDPVQFRAVPGAIDAIQREFGVDVTLNNDLIREALLEHGVNFEE